MENFGPSTSLSEIRDYSELRENEAQKAVLASVTWPTTRHCLKSVATNRNPANMVATPPASPALASLWSHRQPGAKHKRCPATGITILCLILLVTAVSHEISYGLLATSNGKLVSFLKSVHMVNYYWPKSRLTTRSLVGCTVLKFVGSSIISFALGEGLLIASPRHLLSFVWAFSFVRSDSVEATQLARHMRHSTQFHLLLNFMAAVYKIRKLGFLIEAGPPVLGSVGTVLLGTVAFSAANFIMKLESLVLNVTGNPLGSPPLRPATAASPSVPAEAADPASIDSAAGAGSLPPLMALPDAAPAPPGEAAAATAARARPRPAAAPPTESEPVEPPNMPKAIARNFCLVATLMLGERCGQLDAAKVLVLVYLCCYYNKNLYFRGFLRPRGSSQGSPARASQSMLSEKPARTPDAYPVSEGQPLIASAASVLKPERAKQE